MNSNSSNQQKQPDFKPFFSQKQSYLRNCEDEKENTMPIGQSKKITNNNDIKRTEFKDDDEFSQHESNESREKISHLKNEIGRLSRLNNYQLNMLCYNKEKIISLRKTSVDNQLELIATRSEFRKLQYLNDRIMTENKYLKKTSQSASNNNFIKKSSIIVGLLQKNTDLGAYTMLETKLLLIIFIYLFCIS